MSDPREWTSRQRDAVLASLLTDFLATIPTERTAWTADRDELARRTDLARDISHQMDRVANPDPLPKPPNPQEP